MLKRRRKKTIVHLLRITAMFFTGLAVALVIAVYQLDVNTLKPAITGAFEASAGLPIEIGGEMSWKLSLRPQILIKDVGIKNADWAKHRHAVRVPQMLVRINLLSIIRNSPTIQSVKLVNPVANIERNAKGELSVSPERAFFVPMRMKKNDFPFDLDFGVGSIELENPRIFFTTPESSESFSADRVKIGLQDKGETLDYAGYFVEEGGSYAFALSFSKYSEKKKVFPVKLTVVGNAAQFVLDVDLNGNSKMPESLKLKGEISDWRVFGASLGIPGLPRIQVADVSLDAELGRNSLNIRGLSMKTKRSDLEISGRYDFSAARPKLSLVAKSDNFWLGEVFPGLYGEDGSEWIRPNRPLNVFKDVPLYSENLSLFDSDIKISAGRMVMYRNLDARNITAAANIKDGYGTVSVDADFMGGTVRSKTILRDARGTLRVWTAGRGRNIVVGELMSSIDEKDYISDLPANFDFYLRGRGRDLSGLVSSSSGPIRVMSNAGGYAHEGLVGFLYGQDFLTSVKNSIEGMFNSRKKNDQMRISCAVANLKVRGGRIEMDHNVATQTKAVNIRAIGDVDFGRERMKISLDTRPVDGIKLSLTGNVVNSMEFSGNLAEPDIKWNRGAIVGKVAAAAGIGLVVGALTGGVGLLVGTGVGLLGGDVLGNWAADEMPCKTALKDGAPESKPGDPWFMNRAVDQLVDEFMQ